MSLAICENAVLPSPGRRADRLIVLGLLGVLAVVLVAMAMLWRYKSTPGAQAPAPDGWPVQTQVPHHPELPTLVLFAHPMCACTRATLSQLRVLLSEVNGRVSAHVLLSLPEGASPEWLESDIQQLAEDIPGVSVSWDDNEVEASLFDAKTSGHVVLYSAQGERLFQGGITSSRGHEGDNVGRLALAAAIRSADPVDGMVPVFGCELEAGDLARTSP